LSLPSVLPLNADIQLVNAGSYTGATFTWNVDPVTSGSSGSGALGVLRPVMATSAIPRLSLASMNLSPGPHRITVQASIGSQTSSLATAFVSLVQANLSSVRVFPNPWRSDRHSGGASQGRITFDNLSAGAAVKIFTASGHHVRTLVPGAGTPDFVIWDRKNEAGDTVASGIYLYVIKDTAGEKSRGKIVIVK
jgi:hypothetical protein